MRRTLMIAVLMSIWIFTTGAQTRRVSLLALGDMNLGRHVGQMLLRDSLAYPFEFVGNVLSSHDVVFGNLESQVTDQHGETQHPSDRYIFCAPPQAARSLRQASVTVVSTANNHAFDYKMRGLQETASYLNSASVLFVGTSKDSVGNMPASLLEVRGIRIGFLAYTQFVNRKKGWTGHIALYDRAKAREEIRLLRKTADIVVVSYHGGLEYVNAPDARTFGQMTALVDDGADVVLGHHPHVPQGIRQYRGKWIFCSLGNFIFAQPQREWTQKSFAVSMTIEKSDTSARISGITLLPLSAGFQPSFSVSVEAREALGLRLRQLSNVSIDRKDTVFVVHDAQTKE